MATITKEYLIAVPPRILWDALTDPQQIDGWGAGPNPVVDLVEGGAFSLWDGEVTGKVLDVEEESRLVCEWHMSGHETPTEVTITLEPDEEGTKMTVMQTGVPEEEVEEFDRGWDEFYAGPIKEFCEQS
ncbi:MAG TPA: SRPBCC domain-containing protein [Verrucomicrobiae bacterium]|nr:SRPBCC domain-containing protein [Verrucomicrobiae bacterium]